MTSKQDAPTPGAIYDSAVALEFFKAAGKPQEVAQGTTLFAEHEKARPILFQRDKMYLLLEGEVDLLAGKKVIGTVRNGEVLGEMAPISQAPRSATAVAKTPCRLIALDDKEFQVALGKTPAFALMLMSIMIGRLRQTIARLKAADALRADGSWKESAAFDPERLAALVRELEDDPPIYFDRRKPIIKEGQTGTRMYAVLEGTVAVSIGDSVVERLGPGGVFGELALLEQSPRLASAVAETDCSLLPISRNAFLTLVRTNPRFAALLLRELAERLKLLTSRLP